MSTFIYKARRGQSLLSGEITGENEAAAVAALRGRGLTVVRLRKKREKRRLMSLVPQMRIAPRIRLHDKALFIRQFAAMIDAGVPVLRALSVLEAQTQNPSFKKVVVALRTSVEAGAPLSESMARQSAVFDRLCVSMVRAGELSGALDHTLNRLALQLEADHSLRRSVRAALVYPVLIAAFALVVLLGMLLFIIPVFANMYGDLGGELPLLTRVMVGVSHILSHYWFVVVSLFAGAVWGLIRLKHTERGRQHWDRRKLALPLGIGEVTRKVALVRFSRTLATLVRSGVPILEAIEITGQTAGNALIETSLLKVSESVQGGETLAAPLRHSGVFPPMVVSMVAVGEETGALDAMLDKIAAFYEKEVNAALKALTSIIEPVMMVVVGSLVGLVVISVYLPMFNMMNLVK